MSKVNDNFKRTTISLRPEEYETLRYLAFKQKTSIAGIVRSLIVDRLEDEEDIRDGMKALQDGGGMDWESFKKEHLAL
jgi:predicted DNA-binding protein